MYRAMAASFDFQAKFDKSERLFEAAALLLNAHFYRQATIMCWLSVRDRLFGWLEMKQIQFDSTRTALVMAMSNAALTEIHSDVAFAYTVGTMAEWDEN